MEVVMQTQSTTNAASGKIQREKSTEEPISAGLPIWKILQTNDTFAIILRENFALS